ncbi:MAG: DNA starvation/stationary phase protection protein Dps [Pseudomonadota bacterium]
MMYATRNNMDVACRLEVIALLQARLCDTLDLGMQAKQAHWNVKGPNFLTLHELFDRLHQELDDHADTIAERIVALGGQALGTVQEVADQSALDPYPIRASAASDHISAFGAALSRHGTAVRADIDAAANLGDQATSDLFTEVCRGIDKALWLVEAHG